MRFRDSRSAQEDHQGRHHVPKTLHPHHHLAHGCQTPLSVERVKQGTLLATAVAKEEQRSGCSKDSMNVMDFSGSGLPN